MFSVGDIVMVRPDLNQMRIYEGVDVVPEMMDMAGRIYVINSCRECCNRCVIYHLEGAGGWSWSGSMLCPVDVPKRDTDSSLIMSLY